MNEGILYYNWVKDNCEFALLHRGRVFSGHVNFDNKDLSVENDQSLLENINKGFLWRTLPMEESLWATMSCCVELQMIMIWMLDDAYVNIPLDWYSGIHGYYGKDSVDYDNRVFRYRGIPWWEIEMGRPSLYGFKDDDFEKDILYYGIGDLDMGTMIVENARGCIERVPCRYFTAE